MNDPVEIKKFIKGNRKIFEKIYNAYAPNMYSHCLRMARNEDDAKDMLQESFIRVYNNRNQFDPTQSLGGWIRKIVINTSLNFVKKHYSIQFERDEIIEMKVDFDEEENEKLSKERLTKALESLPEGYRMIFSLYVIEGLTHPEIAEYLDISVNTSKSQLHKAKKMLKAELNTLTTEKRIYHVS
ncbi:MAG: RNA polymerase sigma factor [Crocinitomicaceae bacterium]